MSPNPAPTTPNETSPVLATQAASTPPAPYYQDQAVTIYCGDCMDILPRLGRFDLLLTDPPYGINMDCGHGFGGRPNVAKRYVGGWDSAPPAAEILEACLALCERHIVWGGNYMARTLPQRSKWLVWDKQQPMPTYSAAELAWTSLPGVSVKMFRYCGAGIMAREKYRAHPTQKPEALIRWCIGLAGEVDTILDPFAGVCTTGRAAKDLRKKCVCIEREERYCEAGALRMAQEVLPF